MTAKRRQWGRSGGFTLLELLIAILVFGFVSALAYGGFNTVTDAKARLEHNNAQLAALQLAFSLMGRDMEQIVPRGIRDDFGDAQPAVRAEGDSRSSVIEFTRSGWRNPAGLQRSHLQRVAYAVEEEQLVRRSWAMLDRVQGIEPQDLLMLENVKSFKLRLLGPNDQWHEDWPPLSVQPPPAPAQPGQGQQQPQQRPVTPVPKAIEVTVELEGWGRLKRLFPVAGSV